MFRGIIATGLLVRDLAKCTAFYRDTLGLEVQDSDPDSVGFVMKDLYFFLLEVSAAERMMSEEPGDLKIGGGPQALLAARVDDVDAMYEDLKTKGVNVLKPPTDQAWGLRTAYFADPEGNLWEINQPVASE